MAEKMGTHFVREICQDFKDIAAETSVDALKEKLTKMAGDLEPLAGKIFFKTQKGRETMEQAAADLEGIKAKLTAAKDEAEADGLIGPLFETLEKTIKHVKTMKVRMT
ncbi:MAG: hypothetical protein QNJ61_10360 [Desulfobacterales bacterium]|nr:hypothetical protein [Desulfobacterales bacterium]